MRRNPAARIISFFALVATGCNPLVFAEILEDAPVADFELQGPDGRPAHSSDVLVYDERGDGIGHALTMGPDNVALVWLGLSEGAKPVSQQITKDQGKALIFPIESRTAVRLGGIARVPSPAGDDVEHAIVSVVSIAQIRETRIVRFAIPTFARTDSHETDIVVPVLGEAVVPGFGFGLAAVDLDGDQLDPHYEVMVGSDIGVFVYDDMGENVADYVETREELEADDPDVFAGDNAPDGYPFTLCDDLAGHNDIVGGPFLADRKGAFVVASSAGLTIVAEQDGAAPAEEQNAVGAPIYDCAREVHSRPGAASTDFGAKLTVADIDRDGTEDLLVGDPTANRVFVYLVDSDGLQPTPALTLQPGGDRAEAAAEFGFGLGVARLDPDGDFDVLLVGAPGTPVDGKDEVGSVHVFELGSDDWLAALEDLTPTSGTRHGLWAGGIFRDERDELVVLGKTEGRIHVRIDERDPRP
jgi:hypothetical protein